MKRKSGNRSAFFNRRVLLAFVLCSIGVFIALLGTGAFSNVSAGTKSTIAGQSSKAQAAEPAQPRPGAPDVVRTVGPVRQNQDLRSLPYIAPNEEVEEFRLTRHPFPLAGSGGSAGSGTSAVAQLSPLMKGILRPTPNMPAPLLTFDGMSSAQSGCGCLPPDSDGDVGPNNYMVAVNSSIKIFDKSGNPLNGANGTTFNSFFSPLGAGTPCGLNQNRGDPFVMYDHIANRWVVSDFAFPSFPGSSFWQCIGVSQTADPVAGGWFLYAVQVDPANPTFLGDYPKMGLWPDAYYLTMNLFSNNTTFNGVRVYALDRASMVAGGPTNAIGFTVPLAGVGDSYSFVAASFRTGNPPPAGRDEFILAVDSPASGGVTLTQVHGRLFHVDFVTPANSTFGVGANHTPNAEITVNGFIDAFTNTTSHLVPQPVTAVKLDTLGDKIMTPLVYQNRSGTESLWASQTVCTDAACTGPTGTRWYQFNVSGGTFPATPVQQQTWTNGGDGLWRWMGSIAVDNAGNTAIGYSTSSTIVEPSIRYAGRLASDSLNDLGQGEAIMIAGGGHQTNAAARWGDYSYLSIDPADNLSFWHVNEYYPATGSATWFTRVGKFKFPLLGSWSIGPNLPSVGTRLVGVYFPPNGKFYAMGGRSSDVAGSDFTHPFEYDPSSNSWTTKSATYPDNQVNNMACGVLTESGTPYIYCVGGSAAGQTTATGRVFRYNPVTDTINSLAGDDWPGDVGGTILPGGFAVTGNKLYILGGFNINVASTNQIWQFDPTAGVGAKWLQEVNTPVGIMYAPTAAIGGIIYVGGASDFVGGLVTDNTTSFSFNPGTNTIGAITAIPRATGETRALTFNGKMLVMGGGRVAPNPSNEVDIYDPGTNAWTTGAPVPAFITPRRNFATDTDGTSRIWLAGGYDSSGLTLLASMEIFPTPLVPSSAVSRKIHGGAGTFDIALPLVPIGGAVGIEDRTGAVAGAHQMVVTFASPVTASGVAVTSGTGAATFSGSGTAVITIDLTGVTDAQRLGVTLMNVSDGTTTTNILIPMGVLAGDTSGNGSVNAGDVSQTKGQSGAAVTAANFREDVNSNGSINAGDVGLVKGKSGNVLPP